MKTSYCSLKDAFKTPDFSKEDDEIIIQNKELHKIPYTIQQENQEEIQKETQKEIQKETFEEGCDYIQTHIHNCSKCSHSKLSPLDIAFNDILNMILIVLMIWIIIYKPKI